MDEAWEVSHFEFETRCTRRRSEGLKSAGYKESGIVGDFIPFLKLHKDLSNVCSRFCVKMYVNSQSMTK